MKIKLIQATVINTQRTDMTYNDIIKKQRNMLPKSRSWWPKYFYHFTDIKNALGIIDKGWIFGRQMAIENNLMQTDNASNSVISLSANGIKQYARLYFRPKTPTQFHNEGYKPQDVRKSYINANCPIPVFFFLDAEKVLNMEGTKFSEVSCAGKSDLELLYGEKSFSELPFDKIFHEGYLDEKNKYDIIKHRHAEVVRLGGIPIKDCLKGIVCRSVAEKQTLLYILQTLYYEKYCEYRDLITYSPQLDMFFNNGIFIKEVRYDGKLHIVLNDVSKRRSYNAIDTLINCEATIDYLDSFKNILNRQADSCKIDYLKTSEINIDIPDDFKGYILLEVYFDDILMFKNIIDINLESLI